MFSCLLVACSPPPTTSLRVNSPMARLRVSVRIRKMWILSVNIITLTVDGCSNSCRETRIRKPVFRKGQKIRKPYRNRAEVDLSGHTVQGHILSLRRQGPRVKDSDDTGG